MDYGPWKSFSQEGFQLINALLQRDAGSRISASEALQHPWFQKFGLGERRNTACSAPASTRFTSRPLAAIVTLATSLGTPV